MDRNEQSLKHAVADRVGVLRGDAAGQRRGNAVGEVPGAELLKARRLGGQAEAEFLRFLAGQVHDQHAVGGAVVGRHRAAQHRASVAEHGGISPQAQSAKIALTIDSWSPHRERRFNSLIVRNSGGG
ncbi:hypothetical protein IVA80_13905 [Bradyrhizobium sp. 139]|nr:hypothetical protein [Bradyrhizobium sp. 139]MCK1741936.1 hypothetical protein [Bradyrhizobium sp. 139]